jgi:hypothetical protein
LVVTFSTKKPIHWLARLKNSNYNLPLGDYLHGSQRQVPSTVTHIST